jgi:methionyl-tRNA synthetase
MKKYKQMRGYDSYMLTGLDEHGQKIQEVAISRGKTPKEHVDEIAAIAKKLWTDMKIEYDDFIRTTEERHIKVAQDVFSQETIVIQQTKLNYSNATIGFGANIY